MIIIKLKGGLGNQLFQYSFGMYLSEKFKTEVKFDLNSFTRGSFEFELEKLGFNINKCSKFDFVRVLGIWFHPKIARKIDNHLSIETGFIKESDHKQFKDNMYYDGYWQDFNFLKNNLNFLKNTILKKIINTDIKIYSNLSCPNVAIHIRGGDYFKSENHVILDTQYYSKAVEVLMKRFKRINLFIFTNDQLHSKRILSELQINNYSLICGKDPVIDFLRMVTCDHFVIANSTFSWWAAILGKKQNTIVTTPKVWNNNSNIFIEKNILNDWFVI